MKKEEKLQLFKGIMAKYGISDSETNREIFTVIYNIAFSEGKRMGRLEVIEDINRLSPDYREMGQ